MSIAITACRAKTGKHLAFIKSGARDSSVTTGDQSPLCAHPTWRTGGNAQQSQQRHNSQKQMPQLKPHRRRKCFALCHWTAVTCEGPAARSSRTASALCTVLASPQSPSSFPPRPYQPPPAGSEVQERDSPERTPTF